MKSYINDILNNSWVNNEEYDKKREKEDELSFIEKEDKALEHRKESESSLRSLNPSLLSNILFFPFVVLKIFILFTLIPIKLCIKLLNEIYKIFSGQK